MPRVETSAEIAAPPEQVWKLMSDAERYPEWVIPTDRMIEVPEGPMGVGSVYKEYGGIAPFKGESEWRVTEFEPHRRQVHVGDDGKMAIHLTIEIEPSAGGSRVTQAIDLRPRWFMAPFNAVLWPVMMRGRAQAAMDETVANAKRELEAGSGSGERTGEQSEAAD